jgi:hypothetical protein
MDVEAEMGRFEQALADERAKYSLVNMPTAAPERQMTIALDCLATCALGARALHAIASRRGSAGSTAWQHCLAEHS